LDTNTHFIAHLAKAGPRHQAEAKIHHSFAPLTSLETADWPTYIRLAQVRPDTPFTDGFRPIAPKAGFEVSRMLYRRIALLAALVGIGLGLLIAWKAGLFYREDYSTPKKAVTSFYVSVVRGDGSSARENVVEPAQVPLVDEARELIVAIRNFRRAAIEKFGQTQGEDVSGGLPTLKDIEEATEKIDGDNAILATKSGKTSLRLKKIGPNWKVDLLSLLPFKTNAQSARKIFSEAAPATSPNPRMPTWP
jgi:hypothetical protein